MEFALSVRQKKLLRKVRSFVDDHVLPRADRWDKTEKFPIEAWRVLSKAGLTGLPIPRKYGGAGEDVMSYVLRLKRSLEAQLRSVLRLRFTSR